MVELSNIPEHTDKALADAIQTGTKPLITNVGKTIGDLWFLAFGKVSYNAELKRIEYSANIEKFKKEIEQRLNGVPDADYKEPDVQVAGQALEKAKYCVNKDILRQMFASLVASSTMKSKEDIVHPSFAEMITQMSAGDAELLLLLKANVYMPIQNFILRISDTGSYYSLFNNIWRPCCNQNDAFKCQLAVNSLERLGLIEVSYSAHLTDENEYNEINSDEVFAFLKNYIESDVSFTDEVFGKRFTVDSKKGIMRLTVLGENFLKCVM